MKQRETALPSKAEAWGFRWEEELPGGHCSRVFATADRVLKVPWQGEELVTGVMATCRIEPWGPTVFEADEASGEVLMQRLIPGTPLGDLGLDPASNEVFAHFFHAFADLPTEGCLSIADYYPGTDVSQMIASSPSTRFLHGDLHHYNILKHGDEWKVIDPKGLAGDPNYEAVAWLRNPVDSLRTLNDAELESHIRTQIDWLVSHCEMDAERILAWCRIDSAENLDGDPHAPWTRLASLFHSDKL